MLPDFATLLRPGSDKENSPARSFVCRGCPGCPGACAPGEKLLRVEEHLRNYVEQLEEIIYDATDLEIQSLESSVCSEPAGISLLAPDHYLRLRLCLARAKFYRRAGNLEISTRYWQDFLPGALRVCSKLK